MFLPIRAIRNECAPHTNCTLVILAFMSANFMAINTVSAMTWSIDLPAPYTSDRFVLDRDRLRVINPPSAGLATTLLRSATPTAGDKRYLRPIRCTILCF